MSRGLRSTCSVYDDYSGLTSICYDDDKMFYTGDTFDRYTDSWNAHPQGTSSCNYTLASANCSVSSAKASSNDYMDLVCSLDTIVDSASSTGEALKTLSERISALEANENKKNVNVFKKPFLKHYFARLRRDDLKTLNYNVG